MREKKKLIKPVIVKGCAENLETMTLLETLMI